MKATKQGPKALVVRGYHRTSRALGARLTPPHTLPACCSPVGGLGPVELDVGLQGHGEPFLQLVYHEALHHTWTVW